jgi:hypothetical protein
MDFLFRFYGTLGSYNEFSSFLDNAQEVHVDLLKNDPRTLIMFFESMLYHGQLDRTIIIPFIKKLQEKDIVPSPVVFKKLEKSIKTYQLSEILLLYHKIGVCYKDLTLYSTARFPKNNFGVKLVSFLLSQGHSFKYAQPFWLKKIFNFKSMVLLTANLKVIGLPMDLLKMLKIYLI